MLLFDNRALRSLPVDPLDLNRVRQVLGACFSRVQPTPVKAPRTLAVAQEVAELLDLDPSFSESAEFAQVFAGNRLLEGMDPVSACYGGHQFGSWAGQLGDGRAITLGEVKNRRGKYWEVQLKGAGPTPYSRRADGRAVLRSSIREFLCSEAMHHLGVPTTRALCLVETGESVMRDLLYDGRPRAEPGAIVCRVAPSFLRFGNFELLANRGDVELLRRLANYTIEHYFPELGAPSPAVYVDWFREVAQRTAKLMSEWMSVGFVHGVMNTDNMSVLGLTIDYGPYGFLDGFDPNWTPNITDKTGRRYRYATQPRVALWNLACFANALFPLVGKVEPLEAALESYEQTFDRLSREKTAAKLGLEALSDEEIGADGRARNPDSALVLELFEVLALVETDWTIFFRSLANLDTASDDASNEVLRSTVRPAYYEPVNVPEAAAERMVAWLGRYRARVREDASSESDRRRRMNAVNPKYVLRNYIAQEAIDLAEQGDSGRVTELLQVFRRPFDEQPEFARFAEKRPDWARDRPGCSMLSCSS
jgi:uncharacterized protein YdiU (UPF0061 family)